MHQRSLKRGLFMSVLVGGLAVASPVQVHAAPVAGPQAVWKWLERIWEERVTVLWERPGAGRGVGIHEKKAGGCIDPKGCSTQFVTPTAGPMCHAWSEAGVCIDPNG